MTKLSSIPDHQDSITCGLCKHHSIPEVANLIAVVGGVRSVWLKVVRTAQLL